MAQGAIKPKRASAAAAAKPSAHSSRAGGITKKGQRTVAPKKAKLIKAHKMVKKLSGSLTAQTEKMLGARAGHLELLLGAGAKAKKPKPKPKPSAEAQEQRQRAKK
jgi:hypothetical protein